MTHPSPLLQSPAITGDSYASIHCACGYEGDYMEFKQTPVTGDLPISTFQCPTCRRAWTLKQGPTTTGWSGMLLPGKTQLTPIPAVL